MPSIYIGLLEDVQGYDGKNGYGCNITMSTKVGKKTKRVTFQMTDKNLAQKIESYLDEEVVIVVGCNQNNFGTRLAEVIEFYPNISDFLARMAEKYADAV